MTATPDERGDHRGDECWREYYAATNARPPRETLVRALESFSAEEGAPAVKGTSRPGDGAPGRLPRLAVDLGCGAGNDALELLRHGWRVLATDQQVEAIDRLRRAVPAEHAERLEVRVGRFADLEIPAADLVNASLSLPFAPRGDFSSVWSRIVAALPPGGRFAGHFFGVRDGWAPDPELTFHTEDEVRGLCDGFVIEHFHERDEDGVTARGDRKHWHVFSVVARRTDAGQRRSR